jgi:hypothetical protein
MGLPDATGQYTILSTGFASGNLQLIFLRPDEISASGSVSADAASSGDLVHLKASTPTAR